MQRSIHHMHDAVCAPLLFFFSFMRRLPLSTLFPYTTLFRSALLGVGRANLVARSPRAPAGPRRAAAAAGVASQACVGGVGALCHHIRAGTVQDLNGEVGGGSGGCGGWWRLARSGTTSPSLHQPPEPPHPPPEQYCVTGSGAYLCANQP